MYYKSHTKLLRLLYFRMSPALSLRLFLDWIAMRHICTLKSLLNVGWVEPNDKGCIKKSVQVLDHSAKMPRTFYNSLKKRWKGQKSVSFMLKECLVLFHYEDGLNMVPPFKWINFPVKVICSFNCFVGYLNKRTDKKQTDRFTMSLNDAVRYYFSNEKAVYSCLSEHPKLFHVSISNETSKHHNTIPIYWQVIDNGNMMLHQLAMKMRGRIVNLKQIV